MPDQDLALRETELFKERVRAAFRDGDARGITYSQWGEDFDLNAQLRSKDLVSLMWGKIFPNYAFADPHLSDSIPPPARIVNISQAVLDIFDYSQRPEITGLTVLVPSGILALDDFMDLARLYLTKVHGADYCAKMTETASALSLQEIALREAKIAAAPQAALVLAATFLQEAKDQLSEFYLVPNCVRTLHEIELNGQTYLTDAKEGFTLGGETWLRMIAKKEIVVKFLAGDSALPVFGGFYQLHSKHQIIRRP